MFTMPIKELENLGNSYSALAISSVEKVQSSVYDIISLFVREDIPGVFMCLNKPHSSVKQNLDERKINTDKIFFIDCITRALGEKKEGENVLHVQSPADLTGLSIAVTEFLQKIPGSKFMIIDALTTFLIYNQENLVVKFVKSITEQSSKFGVKTVILTPEPRGGNMINKISLFFDKIIRF